MALLRYDSYREARALLRDRDVIIVDPSASDIGVEQLLRQAEAATPGQLIAIFLSASHSERFFGDLNLYRERIRATQTRLLWCADAEAYRRLLFGARDFESWVQLRIHLRTEAPLNPLSAPLVALLTAFDWGSEQLADRAGFAKKTIDRMRRKSAVFPLDAESLATVIDTFKTHLPKLPEERRKSLEMLLAPSGGSIERFLLQGYPEADIRKHYAHLLYEEPRPVAGAGHQATKSVDPALVRNYLETLHRQHHDLSASSLRLRKTPTEILELPIDELYIELRCMPPAAEDRLRSKPQPVREGKDEPKTIRLQKALAEKRLLIEGVAGSGKSTFLQRVAFELSQDSPHKPLAEFPLAGFFPIHIRISKLEEHIQKCWTSASGKPPTERDSPEWIPHYLHTRFQLPVELFQDRMNDARTVVMLDGLDESPDEALRLEMTERIGRTAERYAACRYAVTTRPGGSIHLKGFARVVIEPLEDEAKRKFLRDWSGCIYARKDRSEAGEYREALLEEFQRTEIRHLASNPLMLTMLAVLHFNNRATLPEQRAELYDLVLQSLASSRPTGERSPDQCLDRLSVLAFHMQGLSEQERVRSIRVGDGARALEAAAELGVDFGLARRFLEREELHSGIISGQEPIEFLHLTFQEYLTARRLGKLSDRRILQEVLKNGRLFRRNWREVMRLLAGLQYFVQSSNGRLEELFASLSERALRDGSLEVRAQTAAVLNAMETDVRPKYRIEDAEYAQLVAGMTELFELPFVKIDPVTRAEAAEALGQSKAGDPRLRMPWEKDYWVEIPEGEFRMGAEKGDPQAWEDETLREGLEEKRFWMGRYPVTVWEYAAYLQEAEPNAPAYWEQQKRHPSRPVVWVDWHQATAFCAWASRKSEAKIVLPREERWEYAARGGGKGRRYPWGDEPKPDETLANFKMDVGEPSPVGLYPLGDAEWGKQRISDLAGNVLEWTSSPYDKNSKVVRGGSFDSGERRLRCSYRDWSAPDYGSSYLGFRVIRE
jgi:formylglycine-generating enzyme required for sulfatase activity